MASSRRFASCDVSRDGLHSNLVVGVIGAFLGGFVFGLLRISAGRLDGSVIAATIGMLMLLLHVRFIGKA